MHVHKCVECGTVWQCSDKDAAADRCAVIKAVRVNGQGPYCTSCVRRITKTEDEDDGVPLLSMAAIALVESAEIIDIGPPIAEVSNPDPSDFDF